MQGFIKQEIGPKGEVCEFHTITRSIIDFSKLPNGEGKGGSPSFIRVSTFVNLAFYNANNGDANLAVKHRNYKIDLPTIAQMVREPDGLKSVEQKAYEIILDQDQWFQDAVIVE